MARSLRTAIPLGSVIAERELSFETSSGVARTIRVQVGAPVSDPDHPASALCPIVALGFDKEEKLVLGGIDSMQALISALQTVPHFLQACARQYRGQLTWVGNPDIGFPGPRA
jgi:hypothetical protein